MIRLALVLTLLLAATAQATVVSGNFVSGGNTYPYLVYVPSTYHGKHAVPLLVMAHGCQTTAKQQMDANLYNPLAERKHFIVLYPDIDALEAQQPGPTNRCWQFPEPTDWTRGSGDPAAIAGMTLAAEKRWNIDHDRVYLMGMSAGSFMTSIMAATYPELYAAVGIMAGGAYADGTCLFGTPGLPVETSAQLAREQMDSRARIIPRLVMGGDSDQGVSPACADKAFDQGLRTNNLVLGSSQTSPISLTPARTRQVPKAGGYASTVTTYLDPAGCEIGERWLIHGMNHFWSGGSTDPKLKSFTDPKGPSGAEVSWRFFSRYRRPDTSFPCAEAPKPCKRRVTIRLPRGIHGAVRVRVAGRRVHAARHRRRLRVTLRGRGRVTVVVLGRHLLVRRSYAVCS